MSNNVELLEADSEADPPVESAVLPTVRPRQPRLLVVGAAVLLLVGIVTTGKWIRDDGADVRDGTTLVGADGLAARHGIDITLIGTTAAGGLIDFRYQVVDPDKANPIIHDVDLLPALIVEETGATIALTSLPHHGATELELGRTYYFLFANANNAIRRGSEVTVVMGDVRIEHFVVQG